MLRITFTHRDLARSGMVSDLGPEPESIFALHLYGHEHDLVSPGSRRRFRDEHPDLARRSRALVRRHRTLPHLMDQFQHELRGEGEPADAGTSAEGPPSRTAAEFRRAVVDPHWDRISQHLQEVRTIHGRTAITSGIERLLGSLHPGLYWESPVLMVRDGTSRAVDLNGDGLLLVPSFFLHDDRCVLLPLGPRTGHRVALAFPVNATMKAERGKEGTQGREVGNLIGHTRSAALRALADACTTSELARRLNISTAGASQHASVLRRAGLIDTRRRRNTATHSLTTLGGALLRGHGQSFDR